MNNATRLAAAGLVVAAVLIVGGYALLPRTEPGSGPSASRSPGASVSPGRYVMPEPNTDGVGKWPVDRLIVTVPDGWTQVTPVRGGGILKGTDSQDAIARLTFGRLGSLDPGPGDCPPRDLLPGQTVDDLTSSLRAIMDVEIADLAIRNYVGKRVDFTVPDPSPECQGPFGWFTPSGGERWQYSWDAGWHHQLSILDIAGVRFLIDASYGPDASPEVRAEVQAIVDSVELE